MDGAVRALCDRVKLPGFCLLYRDAVDSTAVHYRIYQYGQLEFASNGRRLEPLESAIARYGPALVAPHDKHLREVWADRRSIETVLISGFNESGALGKILVWTSAGETFSAYTMDLLHLLASTLSQRLIDYNRERIHLSQFFSTPTIDKLLRDPDYEHRYLAPRAEDIGILFADINGFTRICEQVLERPERIGTFVDDWSEEAVRIVHRHGGVFDKMVGDCIIGLWGPPFFSDTREQRAGNAVKAAIEIQRFTRETMSAHPEVSRLSELLELPGLGVAIGVNLANSFCGLFGPNRNYTAFSTGMNQTARLQALGGFRETLVMQSVLDAIKTLGDPELDALRFGPIQETPVKNVAQPLRYAKLLD
jgi:class 3 adenylate cyclase